MTLDWELIKKLAWIGCTPTEIATVCKISVRALSKSDHAKIVHWQQEGKRRFKQWMQHRLNPDGTYTLRCRYGAVVFRGASTMTE